MMQYRKFGNTGLTVSALGFGCMRLPLLEDESVDEAASIAMIRHAIDQGVNYIDTAYPYLKGASEIVVGKALKDGYREKTLLADKCPVWLIETEDDFDRILDEQLKKLEVDTIDFYLLHALDRNRFEDKVKKFHLTDKMAAAKKAGKIRYLGFSFHDEYDVFCDIVDYTDLWDFCQIQYNYINTDYQAGKKGLHYAASKGLAVIVMEPLLGGKLAELSPHIQEIVQKGSSKSAVELALDYLWNQPEVSLLLSGMSTISQVRDNLAYAKVSGISMLGEDEQTLLKKVKEVYDRMALVGCTGCAYCMPCPFGLPIPEIFAAYNMTASHEKEKAREVYNQLTTKADACQRCRRCEKECPQHIKISDMMEQAAEILKIKEK